MKSKAAAEKLVKLLEKYKFTGEEKEAVLKAIGVLSWAQLGESMVKNLKNKRKKK